MSTLMSLRGRILVFGLLVTVSAAAQAGPRSKADLFADAIQRGRAALASNAPDIAAPYFSTATQLAPDNTAASLFLAEAMMRAGQARRAEAYLLYRLRRPGDEARAGT